MTPRRSWGERANAAAEAECVLCGSDAVRNVLVKATMLHENQQALTTANEDVCVPCVLGQQALREKEFQ